MIDNINRQREHFNEISDIYWHARGNSNHQLLKTLIWSHFFLNKKGLIKPEAQILEPMCGMAEGFQIIKNNLEPNINYTGFDYSEKMVEVAKYMFPNEKIEWCDVTTYDAQDKKFDFIILIGGLHHVYHSCSNVIDRLSLVLSQGGHFLSFEPTQNSWLTRKIRERIYAANSIFDEQTEQGFEFTKLDAMFESAGLEKIDQIYPGLLSYILYYNPDAFPKLNLGGEKCVKAAFCLDRLIWKTWFARKFSFATMTLWRKK